MWVNGAGLPRCQYSQHTESEPIFSARLLRLTELRPLGKLVALLVRASEGRRPVTRHASGVAGKGSKVKGSRGSREHSRKTVATNKNGKFVIVLLQVVTLDESRVFSIELVIKEKPLVKDRCQPTFVGSHDSLTLRMVDPVMLAGR